MGTFAFLSSWAFSLVVAAEVLGVVTNGLSVGSSASVVLLNSNKHKAEKLSKQKIDLTERDLVFLDMVFYFWVIKTFGLSRRWGYRETSGNGGTLACLRRDSPPRVKHSKHTYKKQEIETDGECAIANEMMQVVKAVP